MIEETLKWLLFLSNVVMAISWVGLWYYGLILNQGIY